jgi:hypothetical protein
MTLLSPIILGWQCHVRGKCSTCPGPFFGHVVIVEATVHIIQSSVIYMPVLVPLQLPESQHGRPRILGESNVINSE